MREISRSWGKEWRMKVWMRSLAGLARTGNPERVMVELVVPLGRELLTRAPPGIAVVQGRAVQVEADLLREAPLVETEEKFSGKLEAERREDKREGEEEEKEEEKKKSEEVEGVKEGGAEDLNHLNHNHQ